MELSLLPRELRLPLRINKVVREIIADVVAHLRRLAERRTSQERLRWACRTTELPSLSIRQIGADMRTGRKDRVLDAVEQVTLPQCRGSNLVLVLPNRP